MRRLSAEEIHDALVRATNVYGQNVTHEVKDWSGYAMDLPCPLQGVCDQELMEFLFFLGRGDRGTKESDLNVAVVQTSLLLYSNIVKNKVLANTEGCRVNKLLVSFPPWTWREGGGANVRKLVEELYLATLSRLPSEVELEKSVAHLQKHRDIGVEDLQWALLNKSEMLVNY